MSSRDQEVELLRAEVERLERIKDSLDTEVQAWVHRNVVLTDKLDAAMAAIERVEKVINAGYAQVLTYSYDLMIGYECALLAVVAAVALWHDYDCGNGLAYPHSANDVRHVI